MELNEKEKIMTKKEIEKTLSERPELMEFMVLASELSDEDFDLLSALMKSMTKRGEVLGTLAEAVAKLQNVCDDIVLTNQLDLAMDHSKDPAHNKEIIEGYRKEFAKWAEQRETIS